MQLGCWCSGDGAGAFLQGARGHAIWGARAGEVGVEGAGAGPGANASLRN